MKEIIELENKIENEKKKKKNLDDEIKNNKNVANELIKKISIIKSRLEEKNITLDLFTPF